MNSFNHYAFGSIGEWLYQEVAGVRARWPGFRDSRLHIKPSDGIHWVRVRHESLFGTHSCEWERADGRVRAEVGVPTNTSATLVVAGADPASIRIDRRRIPLDETAAVPSERSITVGPGLHTLEASDMRI
jgi:alpha-L-rhamnosidase